MTSVSMAVERFLEAIRGTAAPNKIPSKMAAENSASYFFLKHSYNVKVGKYVSNRSGKPAQSGAGTAGIEATDPPNLPAPIAPAGHGLPPVRSVTAKSALAYSPASLDEILNLEQCASWLQQPASTLRKMVQDGQLEPLPFPGDDYRFHARTVLIQMGVLRDALDSSAKSTGANPDHEAKRASHSSRLVRHSSFGEPQTMESLATEADVCGKSGELGSLPPVTRRPVSAPVPQPACPTKTKIVGKSYMSFGRKVQVTYVSGDSVQHRMAETALLDVLVNSK